MPKRVDATQREIVSALRACGAFVVDLHEIGRGVPDLLVWSGARGRWLLLEVKSPGGRLTQQERAWHEACPGEAYIVRSAEEAVEAVTHGR